jgi:hypothetical protein
MPSANCLAQIRAYTAANAELLRAHHFLFDLPIDKGSDTAKFIVMGLNPGEQATDWELLNRPTEESREFDFHDTHGRGRSAVTWSKWVEYFCQSTDVVLGEFFFWSSSKARKEFQDRFGTSLKRSPHLEFCRKMNCELIEHYEPAVVIAPGLEAIEFAPALYDLRYVRSVLAPNGHRLVEHYERNGVPWLFTKHWTGSHGFSNEQRAVVRDYIQGCTK